MKTSYQITEHIDRYLQGALSDADRSAFEEQMRSDADLAAEVDAQRIANELIIDNDLLLLKKQMQKDLSSSANKTDIKYWSGGLAIILVVVLGISGYYHYDGHRSEVSHATHEGHDVLIADMTEINIHMKPSSDRSVYDTYGVEKDQAKVAVAEKQEDGNSSRNAKLQLLGMQSVDDHVVKVGSDNKDGKHHPSGIGIIDTVHENNYFMDTKLIDTTSMRISLTSTTDSAKKEARPNDVRQTDCSEFVVNGTVTSSESCKGSSTGSIKVLGSSVSGGKKPYLYRLGEGGAYSEREVFNDLEKGTYTIYVKDARHCVSILSKTIVAEKVCRKDHAYTFSPAFEEALVLITDLETNAKFNIMSRSGTLVHQADLQGGETVSWNGTDGNGVIVPSGYYIFIIEYQNGLFEKGSITILK